MDYKELIEILRKENMHVIYSYSGIAATAIETLPAERDALLTVSHGKCELCVNFEKCRSDTKARVDCLTDHCRGWQWRGPQKECG